MNSKAGPGGKKRKIGDVALQFIERDGEKAFCRMDISCKYSQSKFDIGNLVRHMRAKHEELAKQHGLLIVKGTAEKKARIVPRSMIAIDKRLFIESSIKLLTHHNLPLSYLEWEGIKQIFDPIANALGITMNCVKAKNHLRNIAIKIRSALSLEMKYKLVCLKVDSASLHNRHILGVNVQYILEDQVVIRTLGMLEVKERQTAGFLKDKILELITSFGVTIDQVFSVTCDNGANMLAAVRKLKDELEDLMMQNDNEAESISEADLTTAMANEFRDHLNLVRCATHTLQLAILDVVNKSHEKVKKVTEIAKKCKNTKYKTHFEFNHATFPPVWCQTRWCGIFKMMQSFLNQKTFFEQLVPQFPELDLSNCWEFINQYVKAFQPLYIATKKFQAAHVSLADFYMEWLMTIREVQLIKENPFANELTESLTNRLQHLRSSMAFKMALYLDPRFNFAKSTVFTNEENEQVQTFIVDTHKRIQELDCRQGSGSTCGEEVSSEIATEVCDKDKYITELFGGALVAADRPTTSNFLTQLKALDIEQRRNVSYDVWKHWMERKTTHPELYSVASVVFATPASQVSVERSFSALGLVFSNRRTGLAEDTLSDIMLTKLNKDLFDKVIPVLYDWKDAS